MYPISLQTSAHFRLAPDRNNVATDRRAEDATTNLDWPAGFGAPPSNIRLELNRRTGSADIHVSQAVQDLLHLQSARVPLRPRRQINQFPESPPETATTRATAYNHNIPPEHRKYLHESNEQLLQHYLHAFVGLNPADYAGQPQPYETVKSDILYALQYSNDRQADVAVLRAACYRLEKFLPDYHSMVSTARQASAILQPHIDILAAEMLQRAVAGALANQNIARELMSPQDLLAAARVRRGKAQRDESKAYYARPGRIIGSSANAPLAEIRQLARGVIQFPNLNELLRFAPMGVLHFQRSRFSHHNPMTILQLPQDWQEPHVSYPGGLVTELLFIQAGAGGRPWPRTVMTGRTATSPNTRSWPTIRKTYRTRLARKTWSSFRCWSAVHKI